MQQNLPPAEETEWTILDLFLDNSLTDDDLYEEIEDPDYVPATPTMTTGTNLTSEPESDVEPAAPEPTVAVEVNREAAASACPPPLREPCGPKCRRRCTAKISEERRRDIWRKYWDMAYTEKRSWMFHTVTQLPTKKVTGGTQSRCSRSFVYWLQDHNSVPQQVCKPFFLSTLGYHPKNDSLVITMMGKSITTHLAPPKDQRGKHAPKNKLSLEPLNEHIESFNPSVSHYRREHAPHRRYLPSDISIKLMYADYVEKGNICSYETYCKAVKEKNISFAKLGEEECEECLLQDQHVKGDHNGDGDVMDCLQCQRWCEHKISAVESRKHYQADAEKDWPEGTSVRSVDLQKIIMLPRMPGEITSAYVTALEKERDVHHSIFWVDNCSAQNKNWCLLSSLVCLVNSDTTSKEDVTLKYFERGHTFMGADSFQHGVEQEMKNRLGGVVYDFEDFVSVVASSNSRKVEVVEMRNADVWNWRNGHSSVKTKKAPKLAEMSEIQLRHGSRSLFFKLSHADAHFTELDFLQKKFQLKMPTALRPQDRGVEEAKKSDIITKLCPLMPPNRRVFWCSLPVSNIVEDEE
ncbi:hypothetical protein SKAU_G00136360 [Synaphobranchus kaupii]|uniref:Uncharacterized protein n=1 Tax=Synaphobranchus kaupii TaxID=118154 RepID=A0A9Q1J401_SYNKA|nr:hypothetical protein SKAU_G00136360 [Synaphobranchus kaupii]